MSRARFLRAATTGEKASSLVTQDSVDRIFESYWQSVERVLREGKKSLAVMGICEKMAVNLFLLSNSPQSDDLLSRRGLVYEQSLRAMLRSVFLFPGNNAV